MPSLVNMVLPHNQAALDFQQTYLLDAQGNFSFEQLVPIPPILAHCINPILVTPEELQRLKKQTKVDSTYYEQGLLLGDDGEGNKLSWFTADCQQRLLAQFGMDNRFDFTLKHWGIIFGPFTLVNYQESCFFSTAFEVPYPFMKALTQRCPEGLWHWSCEIPDEVEELRFELNGGKVLLTEHWINDDYDLRQKDIYWDDQGGVRARTHAPTALNLRKRRYCVQLNYEIPD